MLEWTTEINQRSAFKVLEEVFSVRKNISASPTCEV